MWKICLKNWDKIVRAIGHAGGMIAVAFPKTCLSWLGVPMMIGAGASMTYGVIPYRENKRNVAKLNHDIDENNVLRKKIEKNLQILDFIEKQQQIIGRLRLGENKVSSYVKLSADLGALNNKPFDLQSLNEHLKWTNIGYIVVLSYLLLTALFYGVDQCTEDETGFGWCMNYASIGSLTCAPVAFLISTFLHGKMYNAWEKEESYNHIDEVKQLNDKVISEYSPAVFKTARQTIFVGNAKNVLKEDVRDIKNKIDKVTKEKAEFEKSLKLLGKPHQERQGALMGLQVRLESAEEKKDVETINETQLKITEIEDDEIEYYLEEADYNDQISVKDKDKSTYEETFKEKDGQLHSLRGTSTFFLASLEKQVINEERVREDVVAREVQSDADSSHGEKVPLAPGGAKKVSRCCALM